MIGVEFKGRLGNQLFQYTFYHYLKLNYKGVTFITNPHHSYLSEYFELGSFDHIKLSSKPYSLLIWVIPRIFSFKVINISNLNVPKALKPMPWSIYKGYFQSDWYLTQIRGSLTYKLKELHVAAFNAKYGALFERNKIIAVHIRRTDYLNYGKRDISLPLEYFQHRLDCIKDVEQYKVLFVSDDIESIKGYFVHGNNYIFATNEQIIDFQVIMNADIAIISNSSFSWWAAYLSPKNNLVYAPKNWLGFRIGKEHPKMIMTKKFVWCDVFEKHENELARVT
jgi:hypothetical protein